MNRIHCMLLVGAAGLTVAGACADHDASHEPTATIEPAYSYDATAFIADHALIVVPVAEAPTLTPDTPMPEPGWSPRAIFPPPFPSAAGEVAVTSGIVYADEDGSYVLTLSRPVTRLGLRVATREGVRPTLRIHTDGDSSPALLTPVATTGDDRVFVGIASGEAISAVEIDGVADARGILEVMLEAEPRAEAAAPAPRVETRSAPLDSGGDSINGGLESGPLLVTNASHTCQLDDGGVRCWGSNYTGQLGIGSGIPEGCTYTGAFFHADYCRRAVVPFNMGSGVVAVAAGGSHTCALKSNGRVFCWGSDRFGQLGHGDGMPSSCEGQGTEKICTLPNAVSGITNAVAITAGDKFTCAVLGDGSARCWGSDIRGQLGNGVNTQPFCHVRDGAPYCTEPVAVNNLGPVAQIDAGVDHVCAVEDDGALKCWGTHAYGALGIGYQQPAGCVPFGAGTDYCTEPATVGGVATASSVSAGGYQTCAVEAGGTVKCWGLNFDLSIFFAGGGMIYGQLGIGAGIPPGCANGWGPGDNIADTCNIPIAVPGAAGTTQISAGWTHTCARQSGGGVRCWGSHDWGYSGVGDNPPAECVPTGSHTSCISPAAVPNLQPVANVAAGWGHSCAQQTNGHVKCWGIDRAGALGHLGAYPGWCHSPGSSTYCTAPIAANGLFGDITQ